MNQTAGYLTLIIVMGKCGTLALLGEYDGLIFAAAATMRPHATVTVQLVLLRVTKKEVEQHSSRIMERVAFLQFCSEQLLQHCCALLSCSTFMLDVLF